MKTISYIPKPARGDDAEFEGSIEIKTLSLEEKLEFFDSQGIEAGVGEDGESELKISKKSNMKLLIAAIRMAKWKYVSVSLKKKSNGEEYKFYEDLDNDPDCQGIITDVATAILNGFKVGND